MCLLMLFNKKNQHTFEEMQLLTRIHSDNLKEQIQPLVDMKIILKEPSTKEISNSDYFLINNDFQDKNYKLKIPTKKRKLQHQKQREQIKESAILERRFVIEAAIMKVMKAKKKLGHNELLTEVVKEEEYYLITPDA